MQLHADTLVNIDIEFLDRHFINQKFIRHISWLTVSGKIHRVGPMDLKIHNLERNPRLLLDRSHNYHCDFHLRTKINGMIAFRGPRNRCLSTSASTTQGLLQKFAFFLYFTVLLSSKKILCPELLTCCWASPYWRVAPWWSWASRRAAWDDSRRRTGSRAGQSGWWSCGSRTPPLQAPPSSLRSAILKLPCQINR